MDLVFRVPRLPRPGETLTGKDVRQVPGGKGANQAVGAARLGAQVSMIGRLGDDGFGSVLRDGLRNDGIDVSHVQTTSGVSSGLALIGVEDSGQNSIVVVPGANGCLMPGDILAAEQLFQNADVLLLQFEIPVESVITALSLAKKYGVRTIIDPAPALHVVPEEIYTADVLCPNETEAEAISGMTITGIHEAIRAAEKIYSMSRSGQCVVITLGQNGVVFCDSAGSRHISAFEIQAVDSTAAGDAFAGALAVGLADQLKISDAVLFASAAGALAACQFGAQPAMPTLRDVIQFLRQQPGVSPEFLGLLPEC